MGGWCSSDIISLRQLKPATLVQFLATPCSFSKKLMIHSIPFDCIVTVHVIDLQLTITISVSVTHLQALKTWLNNPSPSMTFTSKTLNLSKLKVLESGRMEVSVRPCTCKRYKPKTVWQRRILWRKCTILLYAIHKHFHHFRS